MSETSAPPPDLAPTPATSARRRHLRLAQWQTIAISVAVVLAVGAGILGLWIASTRSIQESYRHYLIGLAQTAAKLVDPALHARIRRPEQINGPEYEQAVAPLRHMRSALSDVSYIYTIVRDGDSVRFVLDAAEPGITLPDGVSEQSGVWEPYPLRSAAMLTALGTPESPGTPAASEQPVQDQWGTFITGWAPLLDASGHQIGAVGVDVNADVYMAHLNSARNWALLGLAPAGLLLVILGGTFYRIRLRGLLDAQTAADAAADVEATLRTLASERQKLHAVIEGTDVGTWEWDHAQRTVSVDERWAAMIGYTAATLGPMTTDRWRTLVHPDDVSRTEGEFAACLLGAKPVFVDEFRLRHADGTWVWALAHGTVLERNTAGRAVRAAGICLNVSAQKLTELALQDSEMKFRSLFELSPVGIALNDLATGRFLHVNDALVAPTGYTREELLQLSHWDLMPDGRPGDNDTGALSEPGSSQYGPFERQYRRKDGTVYAALLSGLRIRDAFGRDVVWSIVQDISERKAMELALADAACRDRLTGLANRALFMERLQAALRRVDGGAQELAVVLFLDFDRFKLVNDTLGHDAGDELLRQIAGRLQRSLRATDLRPGDQCGNLCARFGGDEFLILINDMHNTDDATRVADRLLRSLAPAYDIFGSEVLSTASIGVVTCTEVSASAEAVVRNADVAMYEAKRAGRGRSVLFNDDMHARLLRHMTIETSLRHAIGTPELSLVFQPIIDLESGQMVSAEALVRWNHPTLGAVSPAEFIPIAEESGLIVTLGDWVLNQACEALVLWLQTDPEHAPRTISVNISQAELALGHRLLEQVRNTLRRVGLPPDRLQLEVTEREVMRNPEASYALLHELKAMGVLLAMDDFGTGTSSLAFLRDYPFNTIKIDRSFVKDLTVNRDVMAVIHATISLVENLGMASLAEGIEEASQLAVLQSLGCRFAQGYFLSRPVPAAQLLDAMRSRPDTALRAAIA